MTNSDISSALFMRWYYLVLIIILQLSINPDIRAFTTENIAPNVDCTSCPSVDLTSLDGIPGYPVVDLLNLCSAADTASLLIYNPAECEIMDIELEIDFDNGLFYGGFVFIDPNSSGTSVVQIANLSDISKPVFSIDQLGAGAVSYTHLTLPTIYPV